jgi:hypothetical protein
MVDCVLTNEAIFFWLFSVILSLAIGWLARDREIQKLNRKINNLEAILTRVKRDFESLAKNKF